MKELKNKIFCGCEAGHCFLDKDADWCRQNFAKSENGLWLDIVLLNNLDAERLRQKDEWLNSLGVIGTLQVCCRAKLIVD
ncbi:MAG: hypothetical protein ACXV8O_08840 [Methylobacter sp.]